MGHLVGFEQIYRTQVAAVGGKGANLGELSRLEGVRVPAGFVVPTEAFRQVMADAPLADGASKAEQTKAAGRRGVESATQLIRDGQRIRVHGTAGYVEVMP